MLKLKWAAVVIARAGFDRLGKHGPNLVEGFDIGDRIRSRRAADRTLIDHDHVVQLAIAIDVVVGTRRGRVLVHSPAQGRIERVFDQRAFAGSAHAGDDAQQAERKLDSDVLASCFPAHRPAGSSRDRGPAARVLQNPRRPARKSPVKLVRRLDAFPPACLERRPGRRARRLRARFRSPGRRHG